MPLWDFTLSYLLLHKSPHFIVAYVFTRLMITKTAQMIRSCSPPTVDVIYLLWLDVVGLGGTGRFPLKALFKDRIMAWPIGYITPDRVKHVSGPTTSRVKQVFVRATQQIIVPHPRLIGLEETFLCLKLFNRKSETMGQVNIVIIPDKEQIVRCQGDGCVHLLPNRPETDRYVDHPHFGVIKGEYLLLIVI